MILFTMLKIMEYRLIIVLNIVLNIIINISKNGYSLIINVNYFPLENVLNMKIMKGLCLNLVYKEETGC